MRKEYEKFYQLYYDTDDEKQLDKALLEFLKVEKETPPTATELVDKGVAIELSSENSPCTLEDVAISYKRAIELDKNCFDAYINLGYFYLNVMDDAKTAKPYFEEVFDRLHSLLGDAVVGVAKCVGELENAEKGLSYLEKNSVYRISEEVLKKTRDDIELLGK